MSATGNTEGPKKGVDWESVEKDWRAGIKTKLEMSKEHKVSRAAIDKHFDKLGIARDLSQKIRQKSEALVTQQAVAQQVTSERLTVTEGEIVEANARLQAGIRIAHRVDIKRGRTLAMKLMDELELQTENKELYEEVGELLTEPPEGASKDEIRRLTRLQQVFDAILSSAGRIDSVKKLSDTLKNLITMEREAFGIGADNGGGGNDRKLTDEQVINRLNELMGKARSAA